MHIDWIAEQWNNHPDDLPDDHPDKAQAARVDAARTVKAFSYTNFVHQDSSCL